MDTMKAKRIKPRRYALAQLYLFDDKSTREIAEYYGVSSRTVSRWLYQYGLSKKEYNSKKAFLKRQENYVLEKMMDPSFQGLLKTLGFIK